jgi:site-specific recombinase XerD
MSENFDALIDVLTNLRLKTDRIRAERKAISNGDNPEIMSQKQLQILLQKSLDGHIASKSQDLQLIIRWLIHELAAGCAVNSLHHKLDDICVFVKHNIGKSIIDTIKNSSVNQICPHNMKTEARRRYLSSMRSLYRFATGADCWSDLPPSLKHRLLRRPVSVKYRPNINLGEIINRIRQETAHISQFSNTAISPGQYLEALVLICGFTGLRISEVVSLSMGDFWVTDRITVMAKRKGNKQITTEISPDLGILPTNALKTLRAFWTQRFSEVNGYAQEPLFTGYLFNTNDGEIDQNARNTYQRLRRFLSRIGYDDGPHSFRRHFANLARYQGVALLEIINLLGHSTTTTAPLSYIRVYPLIQARQMRAWAQQQQNVSIPGQISLGQLAISINQTREAVFRLVCRANNRAILSNLVTSRTDTICMQGAIDLLIWRIREVQE